MEIQEFIENIQSNKENEKMKLSFGKLSENEIEQIKKQTGFDVSNYERIIDNYGIKHALKEHGNKTIEEKRGQIAITNSDFNNIPEIVNNSDTKEYIGKNKSGRDLIISKKELDEQNFYVEEIRTKHEEMALQTFYKRKKPL